jgi:hypothetical protein
MIDQVRGAQLGQNALPLQLNGMSRSSAQFPHRSRAKPRLSNPQAKNFRNSFVTNAGRPAPSVRATRILQRRRVDEIPAAGTRRRVSGGAGRGRARRAR